MYAQSGAGAGAAATSQRPGLAGRPATAALVQASTAPAGARAAGALVLAVAPSVAHATGNAFASEPETLRTYMRCCMAF